MLPGIEDVPFSNTSLYGVLESRYNLRPVGAKETLVAVVVNAEEAGLLRIAPGSAALAAERTTFLPQGPPLEYAQSMMRGDRYKIVLDLVRQP